VKWKGALRPMDGSMINPGQLESLTASDQAAAGTGTADLRRTSREAGPGNGAGR